MKETGIGREQRIATKRKRRGPGKPFVKGDARINRAGVPLESLAFQNALREAFATELTKPSPFDPEGQQNRFERIVRRVVDLAEAGQSWAVEMVWDRIGGKPIQPVSDSDGPRKVEVVIRQVGSDDTSGLRRS